MHMRFGSATHDKPAGESALPSNRSKINNETAQTLEAGRRICTAQLDLRWTYTYTGPTLAYAGLTLDLRWTYAGLTLDLRWT